MRKLNKNCELKKTLLYFAPHKQKVNMDNYVFASVFAWVCLSVSICHEAGQIKLAESNSNGFTFGINLSQDSCCSKPTVSAKKAKTLPILSNYIT